jgi:transmembrane sensor
VDDLIIRSLLGETTAEEERQLIRWRAADPRNDAWYRSLAATWELAGHPLEPEDREPPSADVIIERAERKRPLAAPRSRHPRPPLRGRFTGRRWLIPAGLAAAALATVLWQVASPEPGSTMQRIVATEEARTVRLPDGSAAHLAPGTVLELDPADGRRVRLDGRAYFGIAHHPDQPFIVETSAGLTRVLGTRFDLTARSDEMTVVVVEGRVEVVADSGEVEVGPGETSRVVAGGQPVVGRTDVSTATEWLGHVFIFQATPLSIVRRELATRFERTIIVEDSTLHDRTVTAVFADRSLEQILPALCRAIEARCITTADTVRITSYAHHEERLP